MLRGKKIVLAVTGSIAAYKSAVLIRLLVKQKAEVRIIMTPAACDFITPTTLATLSKNPVSIEMIADTKTGAWNNHVEFGLWGDLMLVAPATANTIAKMANGICDNLLLATYLSARCKVLVAPAMDLDMLKHSSTVSNIEKLKQYGNQIIEPAYGELASGLEGEGRMAEPEEIIRYLESFFTKKKSLAGKKIMVTAGPTYEAIDPVRFIGNHSSGKMGIAIAEAAHEAGAEVVLICGPSGEKSNPAIKRVNVTSAAQMLQACKKYFQKSDVTFMSAAVADFTPAHPSKKKIKKEKHGEAGLLLQPTTDILAFLGSHKPKKHQLIGFALETEQGLKNARKKLLSKNLDYIVLNSLSDTGAGFGYDTNKVTVISKNNKIRNFELMTKRELARKLLELVN